MAHRGRTMLSSVALFVVVLTTSSATALLFVPPAKAPVRITRRTLPLRPSSSRDVRHYRSIAAAFGALSGSIAAFDEGNRNLNNNNPPITTNKDKPRIASALETSFRWLVRCVLLKKCSSVVVDVASESNRALLLQGKINSFSFSARDCVSRFKLFAFRRWDVSSDGLQLGRLPLLLFLCLVWGRLRRFLWSAMLFNLIFYQIATAAGNTELRETFGSIKGRMYDLLGVRPSRINYSLAVDENDVAQSFAARLWLEGILRSLVENSVVGAAAVLGDATSQASTLSNVQSALGLPASRKGNGDGRKNAIPAWDGNAQSRSPNPQGGLTSALLSATAFKLKNASFSEGRVVLEAEAILPNNSNDENTAPGDQRTQALPFAVRARIEPTFLVPDGPSAQTGGGLQRQTKKKQQRRELYNALGFVSPECRLNTAPLTAGRGTLLGKLVPDVVWLPFGMGVAVPMGEGCAIYRAGVTDARRGNDGRAMDGVLQIDGSFDVFSPRGAEEIDGLAI